MASQFFGAGNFGSLQPDESNLQKVEESTESYSEEIHVFNGVEKRMQKFSMRTFLIKARFYQGKLLLEALETINQIYFTMSKDKRLPLASRFTKTDLFQK